AALVRLDDRAEHALRRRERSGRPIYAGIATRAVALATDAIVAIALYMSVVGVVALVASLVGGLRPERLVGSLLGGGWILIAGAYFVLFWSGAGQTPGMRLLRLRVRTAAGRAPSVGRSIMRLLGLVLATVPMLVGFLPVLFDERRRGMADFIAGTVVVYDDTDP
ncbi:MAG: RDD family protein, partial [Actinomycetota bacterium]|nr:RDD family protein [Actinomycetota bacterium]